MKVDMHCHFFPEEFIEYRQKSDPTLKLSTDHRGRRVMQISGEALPWPTPEERIGWMDKMGIDIQVLSLPNANTYFAPDGEGVALLKHCNDRLAELCSAYPKRFMCLACIPLDDVDEALAELDRAINHLGMNGLALGSNIHGKPLNSKALIPFYEQVNKMRVPIFIHPTEPVGAEAMAEFSLVVLVGFPMETTLAATRLAFSGLFERFPNINLILSHLGGALPFLFERIDFAYWERQAGQENISHPPSAYFKRFYYDTAIGYHMPALRCAFDSVGVDHLVLGTDYPFGSMVGFVPKALESVEKLNLSAEEREKIFSRNGLGLLVNKGLRGGSL